jgi:DNA polymerase V
VIGDCNVTAKESDVIVANINGEFICEIINIREYLLLAANSQYKIISINEDDQFTIEGVVIR